MPPLPTASRKKAPPSRKTHYLLDGDGQCRNGGLNKDRASRTGSRSENIRRSRGHGSWLGRRGRALIVLVVRSFHVRSGSGQVWRASCLRRGVPGGVRGHAAGGSREARRKGVSGRARARRAARLPGPVDHPTRAREPGDEHRTPHHVDTEQGRRPDHRAPGSLEGNAAHEWRLRTMLRARRGRTPAGGGGRSSRSTQAVSLQLADHKADAAPLTADDCARRDSFCESRRETHARRVRLLFQEAVNARFAQRSQWRAIC